MAPLCSRVERLSENLPLRTLFSLLLVGLLIGTHAQDTTRPEIYGRWQEVTPKSDGASLGSNIGMQTVHSVLLPSGKILLVSGSSWRNQNDTENPLLTYPTTYNPPPGHGLFIKGEDPFNKANLSTYWELVNNAGIYDPVENTFYRIPHPVPVDDPVYPDQFAPSDMFCTGHMHLPNGNPLFVGGTQYYYPYRTGHQSSFTFDWIKELGINWTTVDWRLIPDAAQDPWCFAGFMIRGRWYPTLVPLLDGRMAIFSGFVGWDVGFPPMYTFQINPYVEFFDPTLVDPANPQAAWRTVNTKNMPNSPFTNLINPDFTSSDPGCIPYEQCLEDNKYDAFKLYPENYLMPDGRIYLTREGDWVSLRTTTNEFMRLTNSTYWVSIEGSRDSPSVSFSKGPDRLINVTSYGTSFHDPNTGKITILGGQPTSNGTMLNFDPEIQTIFAGGLGSRHVEIFTPGTSDAGGGTWTYEEVFLEDNLTMHYSVILPTRQVLIINGGNYDFFGSVFNPLLLTPTYDNVTGAFAGYQKTLMNAASQPRLYHNALSLLPDGRIFTSGGNSARATVELSTAPLTPHEGPGQPTFDPTLVNNNMYFYGDGPMGVAPPGAINVSTETWYTEIFSPPYMFIDEGRQAKFVSISPSTPQNYVVQKDISGKTFYLFHSNVSYVAEFSGLPTTCRNVSPALALIKLPSVTHGWVINQIFINIPLTSVDATHIQFTAPDATAANLPPGFYMLFYVDCAGKPSVAQILRFDDSASEPFVVNSQPPQCKKITIPTPPPTSSPTSPPTNEPTPSPEPSPPPPPEPTTHMSTTSSPLSVASHSHLTGIYIIAAFLSIIIVTL